MKRILLSLLLISLISCSKDDEVSAQELNTETFSVETSLDGDKYLFEEKSCQIQGSIVNETAVDTLSVYEISTMGSSNNPIENILFKNVNIDANGVSLIKENISLYSNINSRDIVQIQVRVNRYYNIVDLGVINVKSNLGTVQENGNLSGYDSYTSFEGILNTNFANRQSDYVDRYIDNVDEESSEDVFCRGSVWVNIVFYNTELNQYQSGTYLLDFDSNVISKNEIQFYKVVWTGGRG